MQSNQSLELTESEEILARAQFCHLMYDKCNGILIYTGEILSELDTNTYEFAFNCKKCNRHVFLI